MNRYTTNSFDELNNPMRKCCCCQKEKALDEFYKNKYDTIHGRHYQCITCKKEYNNMIKSKNKQNIILQTASTKLCPKCHENKLMDEFHNSNVNIDGKQTYCKSCRLLLRKSKGLKIYNYQSDAILPNNKTCYICKINKPIIDFHNNKYCKYGKKGSCISCEKLEHQKYYSQNSTKKARNETLLLLRKNNISFKITLSLRGRLHSAIKYANKLSKNKIIKSNATKILLGCSINDFQLYIAAQFTEGMNWDNYGKFGWHIDHIIPCDYFNLEFEEEQRICFHYTNMQPLWAEDNLSKGNKLIY